ncbi:TetR/AcrR family transcriptional regulator [Gordonia sp. PKS22-38]|uniref:TetR/AcrR family transcriptional regulator n=1 Tax=Gordonia prachuapensis TaxID=3115651 RepID=A0ABU7MZX0_9ACTN|nr:TetR/AcrR family transcriptional regulator [Gordonia sp. PKS22-38]
MPKVTEAHRAARRDEILDAAQRVFARDGYRSSSMSAIIRESGLSVGAIYSYFDGKQALFRAVVERTLALRTAEIGGAAGSSPRSPAELVRSVLLSMRDKPVMTMAPQIWAEAAVEPDVRAVVERIFTQLGEMFRTELTAWAAQHPERAGDRPAEWSDRVTPVLISAIPGFLLQSQNITDFDEEAYLGALDDAYRV